MKKSRKLKNQIEVDARLDLHGFTVEIAYAQCFNRLEKYRNLDYKIVEIVTGQSGIIRYEAPFWFANWGYKAQVSKHNGSFYVYL